MRHVTGNVKCPAARSTTMRVVVGVVLLVLAGCLGASDGDRDATPPATDPLLVSTSRGDLFVPERETIASVSLHEEIDPAAADLPFADGDSGWEPRDVELTYHGIQLVLDEFGRSVPAFVFRYPLMVFVEDKVTFGTDGVDIDGHYEAHDVEFAFDRADGRFMGYTDLDAGFRWFVPPEYRQPFGDILYAMAIKVLGGDFSKEIYLTEFDGHKFYARFVPFDEFRPLPGDCKMWELDVRAEPPMPEPVVEEPVLPGEEGHSLMCLEKKAVFPLWTWSGSQADGSYRLQRRSPEPTLPDFKGEILAPVDYERRPWEPHSGLLPIPDPVLVPPSDNAGDWAGRLGARIEALFFDPKFIQWRLGAGDVYTDFALYGMEPFLLGLPGLPLVTGPIGFDSSALIFVGDGKKEHLHMVHSREGSVEEPDLHLADPLLAFDSEAIFSEGLPADRLPALPSAFALEGQLAPLLPERAREVVFALLFAPADDQWPEILVAVWGISDPCTTSREGFATALEGIEGYASYARRLPAGGDECRQNDALRVRIGLAAYDVYLEPGRQPVWTQRGSWFNAPQAAPYLGFQAR